MSGNQQEMDEGPGDQVRKEDFTSQVGAEATRKVRPDGSCACK